MIYHPMQCLLHCAQRPDRHFLVAAAGSLLRTFDIANGSHVCSWPDEDANEVRDDSDERRGKEDNIAPNEAATGTPPAKRPKLAQKGSWSSSTDIILDQPMGEATPRPAIVKLVGSRDGKHVIAITGEDKCIHVFELSPTGVLSPFSQRVMPKRPCALAMSCDNSTILCADKFGDVYALPLLGKPYEVQSSPGGHQTASSVEKEIVPPEAFKPKANALTVHTKRNRTALQQQQGVKVKKPEKKPVVFDHQLVLGHVSLLTDIASVSLPTANGKHREYIVTSDRDEHIRVSRGLPQTYITEGYCLGHTSFISKLCFLPPHPRLLVSGGGDDDILLWDWSSGQVKQRLSMKDKVHSYKRTYRNLIKVDDPGLLEDIDRIAIKNMVFHESPVDREDKVPGQLYVTVEGVPAIFIFAWTRENQLEYSRHCRTEGNVIDMVLLPDHGALLYSMDTTRPPFSTTYRKDEYDDPWIDGPCIAALSPSLTFGLARSHFDLAKNVARSADACAKKQSFNRDDASKEKSLSELLYGLESLRKRDNAEGNNE